MSCEDQATCAVCLKLKAEIMLLKLNLERRTNKEDYARLKDKLRLTPNEAYVLLTLYAANGSVVSYEELVDKTLSHTKTKYKREDLKTRYAGTFIRVLVHGLRRQLGADSIETAKTVGYRLSPKGILKVQNALEKREAGGNNA